MTVFAYSHVYPCEFFDEEAASDYAAGHLKFIGRQAIESLVGKGPHSIDVRQGRQLITVLSGHYSGMLAHLVDTRIETRKIGSMDVWDSVKACLPSASHETLNRVRQVWEAVW